MDPIRFGIVGTGFIARVIADTLAVSATATLRAVASRRLSTAEAFVARRSRTTPVAGIDALLMQDLDAIYLATPTSTKEAITLAALAAGKHVLVDKPFVDTASVERIVQAAARGGLVFMDATHFVHHLRTSQVKVAIPELVGSPRSLHTTFYVPISDRANIRYDSNVEPMGAVGDTAWYSIRAIAEFLAPSGRLALTSAVAVRDPATGAAVRASGLKTFESGETSTFDVGYTARTMLMDLQLIGSHGAISMDDFALDCASSIAFQNPDLPVGYWHRTGMATRASTSFIETTCARAQHALMLDNFTALARSNSPAARAGWANKSLRTQRYLDAVWSAVLAQHSR